METTSAALLQTVQETRAFLEGIPATRAAASPGLDRWSIQQIVGHLIDSAANNHQRFIRAQAGPLEIPGYDQNHWVAANAYEHASWPALIDLWAAYNTHLAHVIAHIPAVHANQQCTIGTGEPVTLGYVVTDYLRHLHHHVAQMRQLAA